MYTRNEFLYTVKGGMNMKIVRLLGSPRPKGNSAAMAGKFCETAEGLGAEVTTFALNKLKYRGCQACMTCKTKLDKCVLKDDLADTLSRILVTRLESTPVKPG